MAGWPVGGVADRVAAYKQYRLRWQMREVRESVQEGADASRVEMGVYSCFPIGEDKGIGLQHLQGTFTARVRREKVGDVQARAVVVI